MNLGNQPINNINDIRNLLIIVAMDSEEAALTKIAPFNEIEIGQRIKIKLKLFSSNTPGGLRNIYLLKSGIGLQMAYSQAFYVLSQIPIDSMIMFGVGGALKSDLNPGDAILGTELIQHDSVAVLDKGIFPMLPGTPYVSLPETERANPTIETNSILSHWIESNVPKSGQKIRKGLIVSGSQFAATAKSKNAISQQFPTALLVDMEASSLALLAQHTKLPFAVLKTVADRSAPPQNNMTDDYMSFLGPSCNRLSAIFTSLLKEFKK